MLLGEYAVLDGAPALVMAVDRRAVVELEPAHGEGLWISAPEVWAHPVRLQAEADGSLRWIEGAEAAPALTLVTGLLRGLLATGVLQPAQLACRLRIDTSQFFWNQDGARQKLGLGSSAALTVALASVLAQHAGRADLPADRAAWLRQLLELHRGFQGGRGSGLDVAASLYGGLIRYRLAPGQAPQVQALRWPEDVQRITVWSGRSASTAHFLEALEAWRLREPQASRALFAELDAEAGEGAQAAAAAASARLLASAGRYALLLQRLGEAAKIQVFTAEHLAIRALVEAAPPTRSPLSSGSAGAVYKPCGAGGGDLGLALAIGDAHANAIRMHVSQAGFCPVALSEDPEGLRIESIV